jgi:hypothetical protein
VKPRLVTGLAVALAAALAGGGCRSTEPVDVHISIPGVSPFAPDAIQTILIAGFKDEAPIEDFQAGPAFEQALETGLVSGAKGRIERVARADVPAVAGLDGPAAWKAAGAHEAPGTVYLAGSIKMSSEIRKALDRKAVVDGPFDLVARLMAKRRWRLAVDLYIISAATGETLHHHVWSEHEDYDELDKTAEFAFSGLSARIMDKIKELVFASPTIEVRTLLRR